MVTLTRAGNVVVVEDEGREIAVVRPLNRNALVVSSIVAFVITTSWLVSPRYGSSSIVTVMFSALTVAGFVWGLFGRTEVQVSRDSITTRTGLLGLTLTSRTIPIAAATFVRREQFVATVKGTDVVRHRVIVGFETQPQILPVTVDLDGGNALAEMLERERTKYHSSRA